MTSRANCILPRCRLSEVTPMAKKKKKKKNRGLLFGNGAAGILTSGLVLNIVSQVITDVLESYLSDKKNQKKLMKMLRRLTSQHGPAKV